MCRPRWLFVLLLLVPTSSSAIQLHWSTGADTLTLGPATRCTLVIEADPAEGRLPAEWRLLWVADSASIQFVAMDSLEACLLDEAHVSHIHGPVTAADSVENMFTEQFCSAEGDPATVAWQVVDLPAGGRGKLKVAALDPSDPDSSQVLESNEVIYNGGIEVSYPPVILHASSVHQSLQLRVTAVGSGLSTVNAMSIAALDSSWTLPLTVTARSDRSVTSSASVAALLPACRATVGSEDGAVSAGALVADEELPLDPQSCSAQFFEDVLPPPPTDEYAIQPKDFAFARGFVDESTNRYALHLFYIRRSLYAMPADANEKNIGHTWTTDFNTWHPNPTDTMALTVRPGKFDELHVWAPTIVQRGPTFHMLYTGVQKDLEGKNHQRIGLATSTDLNTWTPGNAPVFTSPQVPWASKNPPTYDGQQLRDPFVMADPVNPGQWLMYFVAVDSLRYPQMAVGVARSLGDFSQWEADDQPLRGTQKNTSLATTIGPTVAIESPHLFRRNGRWWLPYSVNGYNVFFETTASADPTDTTVVNWTDPVYLRDVAEGEPPPLQWWHATEYLRIGATEYLVAWNDNASSIDIMGVFAPASAAVDSFLLSCPEVAGISHREGHADGVRLVVYPLRAGAREVGLRLELPSRMSVRLAVYDITGRRRSTLLDGELPAGATDVTWGGRDEGGARIANGMYFVRLTYATGAQVSKLVMLR